MLVMKYSFAVVTNQQYVWSVIDSTRLAYALIETMIKMTKPTSVLSIKPIL